ncbi:hypothetical protein LSTR_LSTR000399 [Laodelphax striatellus]|uniref:Uncharacterized protein n=1 Tax=Laodelphax striatellus TaxID=195883 RepID=A0A482X542_LAOST|nr:hypothetical protein LSTR_LSTR000399 [Laodelphax striatellus]
MPPPSDSSFDCCLRSAASRLLLPLVTLLLAVIPLPPLTSAAPASSLKYDQSQAGDYNVQVHLKNIEVYAILDDSSFANEQYDYDYADMTLKPPPKPSGDTSTTVVTFSPPSKVSSAAVPEEGSSPSTLGGQDAPEATTNTVASTSATSRTTKRCGAGFYRDHFGRCRRVRHPQLPLLSLSHLQRKNNGKTPSSTLSSISSLSTTSGIIEDDMSKTPTTPK